MAVQLGGLGRFETTFKSLQIQFAEFDERVKRLAALTPEQKQPLADGLAELAEARLAYNADRAALLGELTDFRDRHAAALPDANEAQRDRLLAKAKWLDETIIEIVMSEAQNEVADFRKWGFDIIPHRAIMKRGFETADGQRVDVESAFKDPAHPFRIAIVCAMWLTGFDVECLSTLYLDKPMKAHTLMQAIARANRRYPGKDFGLIVDYNGILKSLREALAQYALGDKGDLSDEVVALVEEEERVKALLDAIEATETHLLSLGFNPAQLTGAKGFTRIAALADAVEAVYTSDEVKRRFEILARQVFVRFKAMLMEPSAFVYAERHDNLEAIYKKLADRERLKEASRDLLAALRTLLAPLDQWTRKTQTQAEVEVFILDHLYPLLPSPPFSEQDKTEAAKRVYGFVWQQTASGQLSAGLP